MFLLRSFIFIILALTACGKNPVNNPYSDDGEQVDTYYAAFSEQPKSLDPARSYVVNEHVFTGAIYEPPLQYHYLKRPYTLQPLTAVTLPEISYWGENNTLLPADVDPKAVKYSIYRIKIKPNIDYQPHPAFAQNNEVDDRSIKTLKDFPFISTRELKAEDYVYEIKRLAHPRVNSPIFGLMAKHIVGLQDYSSVLTQVIKKNPKAWVDLRQYPLEGAKVIDNYTYEIKVKGIYPQLKYWLAMPFFSPMAWEVDRFYHQPGFAEKNISLDWFPVGTGPFMLTENNPNARMVLTRNPYYHGEYYPKEGALGDSDLGLLTLSGKTLPFIDKFVFTLEKESIPRWSKFLQGYYDQSGIVSDNFDQAIQTDIDGNPLLTSELKNKDIHLYTTVTPSIFFIGFNMLDPVVGGYTKKQKMLRQAISMAVNFEEFIAIFLNGRGVAAQGPLPPGIFGYESGRSGMNPFVYDWKGDHAQRKSLAEAKKLLAKAGYPEGHDAVTGKPLILSYDVGAGLGGDDSAWLNWIRKQFSQLGIQLQVKATQYNRFQEKVRTGNIQLFFWGWLADYPDPENFFMLLYGPHGKVKNGGENTSNYENKLFDTLFEEMKILPNNEKRNAIIKKMLLILQEDSPWIWGFHQKAYQLSQGWLAPQKLSGLSANNLKYMAINKKLRSQYRKKWNAPQWGPVIILFLVFLLFILPFILHYYWHRFAKKKLPTRKKDNH
ncbi:MAG: ABC transporter substrate-binding protein [Gammaproteobacteria bacterium]